MVNPGKIFHSNSIGCPSVRFNSLKKCCPTTIENLLLPGFKRIVSNFSQTEHRVGEDIDFGSGILISSTVQQACRYPPQILEVNQAYASGFCLTTDQLFRLPEKLSRCFPEIIIYKGVFSLDKRS